MESAQIFACNCGSGNEQEAEWSVKLAPIRGLREKLAAFTA